MAAWEKPTGNGNYTVDLIIRLLGARKKYKLIYNIMNTKFWRQFLFILAIAILILVPVLAAKIIKGWPFYLMTDDPAIRLDFHPFTGYLTHMSVLLWCAATTILIFAASILNKLAPKGIIRFLIASALLSGYLMFDDLFCFHDKLAQQYLGLEQKIVYLFIITVSIAYVITFRRIILSTDYIFLFIALAFLGSSLFWEIEYLYPWMRRTVGEWQNFYEDAGKWLGIAFWTSYFAITSFKLIKAQMLNKGEISDS